jgi:hypothetical protein
MVIGDVVSISPQFAHSSQVIEALGQRPLSSEAWAS